MVWQPWSLVFVGDVPSAQTVRSLKFDLIAWPLLNPHIVPSSQMRTRVGPSAAKQLKEISRCSGSLSDVPKVSSGSISIPLSWTCSPLH